MRNASARVVRKRFSVGCVGQLRRLAQQRRGARQLALVLDAVGDGGEASTGAASRGGSS